MKNRAIVEDWLIRSRSNLCRAQSGQISDEILFEDLCFDCQQSVEKALKGLLIAFDSEAPRTHIISRLIECLANVGLTIPEKVIHASELTEFAVQTRYPGIYEPVTEEEYYESLEVAEFVYSWVLSELDRITE